MNQMEMTRLAWFMFAAAGIGISFCTLRTATYDYLAALDKPSKKMKIVARILARDEAMTLAQQVGFVAVVVSIWIDSSPYLGRTVLFVIVTMMLGANSLCKLVDRVQFDELDKQEEERNGYELQIQAVAGSNVVDSGSTSHSHSTDDADVST